MSIAELIRTHAPLPAGFKAKDLSCAWCSGGDRLSLVAHVTRSREYVSAPVPGYQFVTRVGEPPESLVLEWLRRHAGCEARARSARVRISVRTDAGDGPAA